MINAVYLMSSLPTLTWGSAPPISEDEFMQDVTAQLTKKSIGLVKRTNIRELDRGTKNKKISSFIDLICDLQSDKNAIREAKKHNQTPKVETLPLAFINENPLEREKTIMQMQWDELTALETGDPFSIKQVLVYKLKLQILHRLFSFDTKKGTAVFDSVVHPQQ